MCGGKLFDRISGALCGFICSKTQATVTIASGVAAGFRSARRRLGELDHPRLDRYLGIGRTTDLLCICPGMEVSIKHKTGFRFLFSTCSLATMKLTLRLAGFNLQHIPSLRYYWPLNLVDVQEHNRMLTD